MFRIFLVLFLFPTIALAGFQLAAPQTGLDLITIDDVTEKQIFYGTLKNIPHTFEFTIKEETPFFTRVSIPKRNGDHKISLIVIKEERRGVSEVKRRTGQQETWTSYVDPISRIGFFYSAPIVANLGPGVYRVEVSSPDNVGKYRLDIGSGQQDLSYLESLKYVSATHRFFGIGLLGALIAPVVCVPLVLGGIGLWFLRKRLKRRSIHA